MKALRDNPNAPVNSVKGMSGRVIAGNQSLYGDGTGTIAEAYGRMGKAMDRGTVYAQDIRGTQSVSMPMPALPKMPTAVSYVAEVSPGVILPMGSGKDAKNMKVSMPGGNRGAHERGMVHIPKPEKKIISISWQYY
ncbi:hypothetical protein [Methylobacter svalbardensis]|uniref:hypothetical protein n=1 Tax=Methylobacter svalbardensis TaxID=3080016 RepID=UPI0030ED3B34